MYDLNKDPLEMNNIANESAYMEQRALLQQRLDSLLEQYGARAEDLPNIFGARGY